MSRLAPLLCLCFSTTVASAADVAPGPTLSRFAAGEGPSVLSADSEAGTRDTYRLLAGTVPAQSNAIAWDRARNGAFESVSLHCELRVLEGGDGGAFVFLSTAEHGARGPAPFVESWVEPNLRATFAVGIDVHNPPNEEPFGPWGNYRGPTRSARSRLHWDGREIVKRVAPKEFRGDFAAVRDPPCATCSAARRSPCASARRDGL